MPWIRPVLVVSLGLLLCSRVAWAQVQEADEIAASSQPSIFDKPSREIIAASARGGEWSVVSSTVPFFGYFNGLYFAASGNGQRFLVTTLAGESTPTPLTVVLNWTAGIKR